MQNKEYYIYILETKCGKYYCGITDNLQKRFLKHMSGKGAKFTRSFKPKQIAAAWLAASKENALRIEILIKKLNRDRKEILVNNPKDIFCILGIVKAEYSLKEVKTGEND